MSSNLENNKIFAAVLVAGIVAMLAGFVAEILTEPEIPEKAAVTIEGSIAEGGGEATGPTGPEPILAMIAAADVTKGAALSKACAACHSFAKGEPAKVGPNLWGVIGRKKASMPGFAYSDAMVAHGGTWEYSELNHFLWSPKKFIPGTKMGFIGFKKPEERAAIIAWLRTNADSAHAPPSDGEIKKEEAELAPKEAAPAADKAAAKPGEKPAEKKEEAKKEEPKK